MTNLFIDIETVPEYASDSEFLRVKEGIENYEILGNHNDESIRKQYWKFVNGGLSPIDGKVIMIAYQIDYGPTERLLEWESSEKGILEKLYQILFENRSSRDRPLNLVGFNIASFDLPFLYERSVKNKIQNNFGSHDPFWLYKQFHEFTIHDIMLMHLHLNDWSKRGLNHNAVAMAYDLPIKSERGNVNAPYYYAKQYDKIMNYTQEEFVYPEMYAKMQQQLVDSYKLKRCIQHVRDQNHK